MRDHRRRGLSFRHVACFPATCASAPLALRPCALWRSVAPCLTGLAPDVVYGNHPDWRRPILTHLGDPAPPITGIAAYTGLAYPAEFYGDVFYLLRDSARIYRIDLEPPCFLPHPNGVTPVAFNDQAEDGDFVVNYDIDGDHEFENISLTSLVAIVQAPNPQGVPVLYVAGRQGGGFTDDAIVFRIEYATVFTPYAGPAGRVPDSCFTDGVYSGGGSGTPPYGWENPFHRDTCLPPGGPCPGQPAPRATTATPATAPRPVVTASATTARRRRTEPGAAAAIPAGRRASASRGAARQARPRPTARPVPTATRATASRRASPAPVRRAPGRCRSPCRACASSASPTVPAAAP
jgi:hypothetical protein